MSGYRPETYQTQVMEGIALYLAEQGLAVWHGFEGSYSADERGIYLGSPPDGRSGESVTISPYMEQSNALAVEHTRFQFLSRHLPGNTLAALDWCAHLRESLHYKTHVDFGGHKFELVRQWSASKRGFTSEDGLLEHSQNFIFRGNRYGA